MQCSMPFVQLLCTVRFVYRIIKYSFILGIFNLFRIFVLALVLCLPCFCTSLQKPVRYFNHRVVTLVADKLERLWLLRGLLWYQRLIA